MRGVAPTELNNTRAKTRVGTREIFWFEPDTPKRLQASQSHATYLASSALHVPT